MKKYLKIKLNPVFIFFIAMNLCSFKSHGQIIKGDSLITTFLPITNDSLLQLRYQLHVDSYLDISEKKADTILFKVMLRLPIPDFGITDLKACLIHEHTEYEPLEYVNYLAPPFQNIVLNIKGKEKLKIKLSYNIIGTAWFFYLNEKDSDFRSVSTFHADYENVFPEFNEGILYDKVIFRNPTANTMLFSSPLIKQDTTKYKTSEINLTLIDTTIYTKKDYFDTTHRYSIYYIDSVSYYKNHNRSQRFKKAMEKLNNYPSETPGFDIISAYFNNMEKREGYGKTFDNYIFCDTSFLSNDKYLLHEILHMLYPVKVGKTSSARYFMSESIIEWLTNYLYANKIELKKESNPPFKISLYEAQVNDHTTWKLIYDYGTWVIQEFASENHPDCVFNTIMEFIIINRDQEISYDNFIPFLRTKKYSEKSIKILDEHVKRVY